VIPLAELGGAGGAALTAVMRPLPMLRGDALTAHAFGTVTRPSSRSPAAAVTGQHSNGGGVPFVHVPSLAPLLACRRRAKVMVKVTQTRATAIRVTFNQAALTSDTHASCSSEGRPPDANCIHAKIAAAAAPSASRTPIPSTMTFNLGRQDSGKRDKACSQLMRCTLCLTPPSIARRPARAKPLVLHRDRATGGERDRKDEEQAERPDVTSQPRRYE